MQAYKVFIVFTYKIRIIKFIQYSPCSVMIKNSQDFHF